MKSFALKSVAVVLLLLSCQFAVAVAVNDNDRAKKEDDKKPVLPVDEMPAELKLEVPSGFEEMPEIPSDNPQTPEKVNLGRKLFFDPILSENGTVSCASCHQPEFGFASPDAKAIGIDGRTGKRNAPSLLNRAYGENFLWDGSAKSLEDQALTPIGNPDELGGSVEAVLKSIQANKDYVAEFKKVFGGEDSVNKENLAKAIASFERTLVGGNSLVDQFRASDYRALPQEARTGMWLFESRAGCWKCHSGPNLSDEEFHNTGVGFGEKDRDPGRMEVSKDAKDNFAFKTPTLRGVAETGPFMHDGSVKTLKEVVEFYNKGGSKDDPELDKDIKPLDLSDEEVGFLVEFLKALSGDEQTRYKKK